MKRIRALAVLLCAFGASLPLLSLPAQSTHECKAGQCSGPADCPDGDCIIAPGATCGYCAS